MIITTSSIYFQIKMSYVKCLLLIAVMKKKGILFPMMINHWKITSTCSICILFVLPSINVSLTYTKPEHLQASWLSPSSHWWISCFEFSIFWSRLQQWQSRWGREWNRLLWWWWRSSYSSAMRAAAVSPELTGAEVLKKKSHIFKKWSLPKYWNGSLAQKVFFSLEELKI